MEQYDRISLFSPCLEFCSQEYLRRTQVAAQDGKTPGKPGGVKCIPLLQQIQYAQGVTGPDSEWACESLLPTGDGQQAPGVIFKLEVENLPEDRWMDFRTDCALDDSKCYSIRQWHHPGTGECSTCCRVASR